MPKYVVPSVLETAFNCPHCGALAKQYWHKVFCEYKKDEDPLPNVWSKDRDANEVFKDVREKSEREKLIEFVQRLQAGLPFKDTNRRDTYRMPELFNIHLSECFNCKEFTVWLYDCIIFPVASDGPPPNQDLPEEIRKDYLEASSIIDLSSRGSCALSRLAIQKLLKVLGGEGTNINDDIGKLVSLGLDQRIQKALDVVRVVGNNAVHPGQVDLADNRSTAETLLRLINLIADKMISEPKEVDAIYAMLPTGALNAIGRRDNKGQ